MARKKIYRHPTKGKRERFWAFVGVAGTIALIFGLNYIVSKRNEEMV